MKGIISHEELNMRTYMNTIAAAAVPYCSALSGLLSAPRYRPPLEIENQQPNNNAVKDQKIYPRHHKGSLGATVVQNRDKGDKHKGYAHSKEDSTENNGTPVKGSSTANSVQRECCNGCSQNSNRHTECRQPVGLYVIKACCSIDGTGVDDSCSNPGSILHEHLQPERQLDSSTQVDVSRPNTKEHLDIVGALRLLFHLHDCHDLPYLVLHSRMVWITVASEFGDDLKSLIGASGLDEPSGRLGVQQRACDQEQDGDGLTRKLESPSERSARVRGERGAKADPGRQRDPSKVGQKVSEITLPLWAAGGNSAVHEGVMTIMKATPTPATMRAQSIWARFWALA